MCPPGIANKIKDLPNTVYSYNGRLKVITVCGIHEYLVFPLAYSKLIKLVTKTGFTRKRVS